MFYIILTLPCHLTFTCCCPSPILVIWLVKFNHSFNLLSNRLPMALLNVVVSFMGLLFYTIKGLQNGNNRLLVSLSAIHFQADTHGHPFLFPPPRGSKWIRNPCFGVETIARGTRTRDKRIEMAFKFIPEPAPGAHIRMVEYLAPSRAGHISLIVFKVE